MFRALALGRSSRPLLIKATYSLLANAVNTVFFFKTSFPVRDVLLCTTRTAEDPWSQSMLRVQKLSRTRSQI